MTDDPHQLFAVEFSEAEQPRLTGFSCGEEVWARHIVEWIRGSDVLDSIKRGTKVWLFERGDGQIVGFGSVGPTRRRWPPPEGSYTNLFIVPMLALDIRFQGQPANPEWSYARQIMGHIISEARKMSREAVQAGKAMSWLILHVHHKNRRAIRFYEKCGFELIPNVLREEHLIMYLRLDDPSA